MKTRPEFKNGWCLQFKRTLATQAGVLLLCLAAASSPAQTYTILHTFGTNVMGLSPHAPLVQGPDGTLYGTTEGGGAANQGQVFKVNPDGSGYTVLKDFTGNDGANPDAGLVLSGATLYGTTVGGGTNGNGTVFSLNTDGSGFAVLKQFTGYDGANPYAKLVLSGTVLYGTTGGGGAFWCGTVFKINTDGSGFTVLKHFTGNIDGGWPYAGLALSGTTLYGTANGGGSYGNGTVFKIKTDGSGFAVLKNFIGGSDGGGPATDLVLSGSTLYGTALWGGNSGNGTVFKLNMDDSGFSVIKDFTDSNEGAYPHGELLLSDATLYGTAANGGSAGNGTVFKVNTDGSGFAVLKDFTNSTDGAGLSAGLMLSGTTLFGTTYNGGNSSCGTVFKVETDGSGYAVIQHFARADGTYPYSSLALSGTTLYGTTQNGGNSDGGTIFKANIDGSGYVILKDFTNLLEGVNPYGKVVLSGTTLFGTAYGGSSWNGVVFKVNTDGSGYTVLKDFTNWLEGVNPNGSMVLSDTTLFGTANGGSSGNGVLFKVNTDGSGYTVLMDFTNSSDGVYPNGIVLSGTMLYGTAYNGGSNDYGTVFKINIDGSDFTVLMNFSGSDGANPYGKVVLSGTTLYGTTVGGGGSGNGTLFKLETDASGFAVIKNFTGTDGAGPQSDLVLSSTTLYGTTSVGGIVGYGTVFQIDTDGSGFAVLKHFTYDDGANPNAGLALSGTTLYGTTGNGGGLGNGVLFSLSLLPEAPAIQMQPQSQTVQPGWSANFSVVASGIPAPAYQWFFDGNAVADATNFFLNLDDIQHTQTGAYTVVITNTYGCVTSSVATLTVEDPFIDSQPNSQYGRAGDTVQFNVGAGGTSPLSYQWFKDGDSLDDDENITGTQTPTLSLNNVSGGDGGWFSVVVSNAYGSVTSAPAMLVVQDPFINNQPSDQFVNAGETAGFSIDAGGTSPLSYQWFKDGDSLNDGGNISGAQTATLTLTNVVSADAGGYSVIVSNAYGTVSSTVAQLTVNLAPVDSFDPGADGGVTCLAVQVDGKVFVGGWFGSLGELGSSYLGRLNADGTSDTTFDPGTDNEVDSLAVQADGKILVGGWFSTLGGQTRNYLGRLNANGTVDAAFDPGADSGVHSLAVQPDGKILVGGEFSMLNGQTHNYLGRLNADGTLDTNFNCSADGTVLCIALQADGKILVGGWFNTLDGETRDHIARLNADGTLDTSFNPGAGDWVGSLVVQPDGKILVGGGYNTLGGQTRNNIGRLNADGTLDTSFNPGAGYDVGSLALQADGKILVGGQFNMLGGQNRYYIGRLNADGSLDNTFSPWADSGVNTLAVQPDGKILAGGDFNTLAGQSRNHLGRLNNTEPATQELSFEGSTITWLRGGSGPEIWRTSFEVSTNGTDWLDLGPGVRVSGGWQLTGLSTPTNATVRALGFVSSYGVSSWFVETMIGSPAITVQPQNASINLGSTAVFSVQAGGTPLLGYQWFKDGVSLNDGENISGAQTATLTLSNATGGDAGGYSVVITNAYGSITSLVATLTVEDPFINSQPVSQSVNAGQTAFFSVDAGGTAPLSYQWFKDSMGLSDGGNISGAQSPTLTLSDALGADAGGYLVIVSNSYGSVTSLVANLSVVGDPFIITQPVNQTANPWQNVQFSVAAGGTPVLSYEWLKDGVSLNDGGRISGAQTATLTLNSVFGGDAGGFRVVVSNNFGSVTSAVAVLTVNPAAYSILHTFTGSDGSHPARGLILAGTTLYGTTYGTYMGGNSNLGTVFKINTDGTGFSVLKYFSGSDGANPLSLTLFSSTLYGATENGGVAGRGTVFKISTDGSGFTVLKQFGDIGGTDGQYPSAPLVLSGTTLYGVTGDGGSPGHHGTVFKIQNDGSGYTVLKSFSEGDGWSPSRGLVLSGTTLYGTAFSGGITNQYFGCGTVFKINTDGSGFTVLKYFAGSDGEFPMVLLMAPDTTLYGTTTWEGYGIESNFGTVFKVNTDGSAFTVLKFFTNFVDGMSPVGLLASGGTLYGTASSGGSSGYQGAGNVFEINTDGSDFTVLKNFTGSDGSLPCGSLVLSGTTLYGTTSYGGSSNYGVVFSLSLPPVPASILTTPQSQTAEAGSSIALAITAAGYPPPICFWLLNGTNLISYGTNCVLELTNLDPSQSGVYSVIVSNIAGVVTSAPVSINVIAAVERRPVPAINLMGDVGSSLHLDYADALGFPANWLPLNIVSLSSSPQSYFDVTMPLPPERFYRVWQTGAPGVVPSLNLHYFVPAITLTGNEGDSLRLDYINAIGPTDAWMTLDTVTLTNTSQLYFDVSAPGQPRRLYRIVPNP